MKAINTELDKKIGEKFNVLDHGHVIVRDYMGTDNSIEAAARQSYNDSTRKSSDTKALIRYMWKHQHATPFESCKITFEVKLPIFIARQWMRHRSCVFNELSGRYSELPEEYYIPSAFHNQSQANKQGSGDQSEFSEDYRHIFTEESAASFATYKEALSEGIAREEARLILPLNTYTQFVWTIDARNLFHFLKLRMDSHAQFEIRQYANIIFDIAKVWLPITAQAFEDYTLNAVTFSSYELNAIIGLIFGREDALQEVEALSSKREFAEFKEKLRV